MNTIRTDMKLMCVFACLLSLLLSAVQAAPPVKAATTVAVEKKAAGTTVTTQKVAEVKKAAATQKDAAPSGQKPATGIVKPPVVKKPVKPPVTRIPTRVLVKRLDTTNSTLLVETIHAIGDQDSGSKYVQEAFSRLLTHKEEDVRQAVLDEAYHFDSVRNMLPALEKCLHDPVESIRDDAIDVLSEIETREMIGILVKSLTNEYEDVRDNAEFYLFYHTDDMYTNAVKWFGWWKTNKNTFVFE
jgi:hypothetical protein